MWPFSRSPEMGPPPQEIEQAPDKSTEQFLTKQEYIKYDPGAKITSPNGEKYTIDFVYVENRMIGLSDKEGKVHYYEPDDLKDWERQLLPNELEGQHFFHKKEGWVARVLETDVANNSLKMITQNHKQFEVPFNRLLEEYIEAPDDVYAPFENAVVEDFETQQPIHIERISYPDGVIVIEDCEPVFHKGTGQKAGIKGVPGTSREISFDEFFKKTKKYRQTARYIYGELPDFVEQTITVEE